MSAKFIIEGGIPLKGSVTISGAKNAALPILAATLLTKEKITLNNVPQLDDIGMMFSLLENLGKKISRIDSSVIIEETTNLKYSAPYEIVSKMRASIAVMGPLTARLGKAEISMPGGCNLGPRPIDLHIKGMKELSAHCDTEHGDLIIIAPKNGLIGKEMNLLGKNGSSVLATENILMAATLANGRTVIKGAAKEPEVVDLAKLLTSMGAKISGAGTDTITINGCEILHGTEHAVVADRIEAGTYIIAAAITKGEILIENCVPEHLEDPIRLFKEAGILIEQQGETSLFIKAGNAQGVDFTTLPYPLFPTDLQSQFLAYLALAKGKSVITETIYPDRFMHAAELNRMNAKITVDSGKAVVDGISELSGAIVKSADLRGGATLVIAGLAAKGETEVLDIYHIDRGYEQFEHKLQKLGANIRRVEQ